MAKNKIEELIRIEANNTNVADNEKAMQHHNVCKQVIAFCEEHKSIPLYFALQVGIAKGAFKMSEFSKGYKSFDAEKVLRVYKMGLYFNKHNGLVMKNGKQRKLGDVAIRLVMAFYERVNRSPITFMQYCKKMTPTGNRNLREIPYGDLLAALQIPPKGHYKKSDTANDEVVAA